MSVLALGLALMIRQSDAPSISIQSLLHEMQDRAIFAKLPAIPYRLLHASSYDRAETNPKDPKTWFANADYGQFIRTETHLGRTEWVVMDHMGPGAITHIWTPLLAEKDKMLVRVYLDGSDTPTIEEPFNDWMRGRRQIKPPLAFISWPESGVDSGVGSDLYFPIPYAKSCKVTFSELPFYYSIDYRAYPAGTTVEPYSQIQFDASQPTVAGLSKTLTQPITLPTNGISKLVRLAPHRNFALNLPNGPAAICALQLQFSQTPDLEELRSTVVEFQFDGETTVWAPIGEFFGSGVHTRPVWDRYRTVNADGNFACGWTMPYQHSAKVLFHNLGKRVLRFKVTATPEPWHWDNRSLTFHATWRNQYPLATRPFSDWNYLVAKGNGVYVGDTLTVFSPAAAWYGEGDERVYVDGEAFPSHLGTGTEDYYGYAWGMAEHFSSPFIAMPARDLKGRDNWMGYTTTSRIRGLDAISFDRSIQFDMEIWNWADCQVGYSATSFWYARPGATSNRSPLPTEAAASLPEWSVGIKGAIECEDLKVHAQTPGLAIGTQSGGLSEGQWSNNTQLFVQAKQFGDFVELAVPVSKAGRRHLILYATKSFDYGTLRFSWNGKVLKDVDLWNAKPIATGPIDLGIVDVPIGTSILRAEVIASNPNATGTKCYFGLDCLILSNK